MHTKPIIAAGFFIALVTNAAADTIETVECDKPSAERILAAVQAERNLEAGQGQTAAKLVKDLLASGACERVTLAEVDPDTLTEHQGGDLRFGLVKHGGRYAIGFDFVHEWF